MLLGVMGIDLRLRVCWLLVLRQVFVELMYFGGNGLRILSHCMEVPRGCEWKMRMLWMSTLRENGSREQIYFFNCILLLLYHVQRIRKN